MAVLGYITRTSHKPLLSFGFLLHRHTAGWFPFRRQAQVQEPNHLQPPEVQHNLQNENQNPELNPVRNHSSIILKRFGALEDGQPLMLIVFI